MDTWGRFTLTVVDTSAPAAPAARAPETDLSLPTADVSTRLNPWPLLIGAGIAMMIVLLLVFILVIQRVRATTSQPTPPGPRRV